MNGTIVIERRDDPAKQPKVQPNPAFPHGLILDCAAGVEDKCEVELPYPARGVGTYTVVCSTCGIRLTLTVAGRVDDPVQVILPCGKAIERVERRAA